MLFDIFGCYRLALKIVLLDHESDATFRITCGIIARSAGLFENAKRFCACDGITQWDERNVPLAGLGGTSQSNL